MARQKKTSIDYFPHTTEHGSTMFIIESRWGNDGYATWFKVLERIGSTDGMYLDCRSFAVWQCLVAYTRVSESVLTEILDTVAKIGKIDAELWQQKIIFCQKLVDGVVDAFRRRVESLPTREKVIKAANLDLAGNMTEDCPLNEHNDPNSGQNDAGSTERERERERESKDKTLSSSDDEVGVWVSKKKRKLTGKREETFKMFWDAFAYKTGRAEAIDAWLDIPEMTMTTAEEIARAAKVEADNRHKLIEAGKTPKMAQGWLSGRRWEDEKFQVDQRNERPTESAADRYRSMGLI